MTKRGLIMRLLGLSLIFILLWRLSDAAWAYSAVDTVAGAAGVTSSDSLKDARNGVALVSAGTGEEGNVIDQVTGGLAAQENAEKAEDAEETGDPEKAVDVKAVENAENIENEENPEEAAEYNGKILLSAKTLSLQQGASAVLKAELTEENLTGEKLLYQSSDTKVVTVNRSGKVTAVRWGSATITVSLGKASAKCKITVSKDITITISAAGDCTLSSDIKQPVSVNFFSVYDKKKDDSYFFKNVKPIFEKDDMTIVNFEGTLSNRGKREDKKWAFRGKPSYINILTKGSVEAVAFANNHVRDYGEISYTDTIKSFEEAGISYSSYEKIGIYEVKGMKIGMVSVQETGAGDGKKVLRKALKTVKKEKPDLLIVSFHWGIERSSRVTKVQKDLSRIAIDEGGANLVLGHHPHVLQPIEKYKNAYIVYSLGNFCFGGNTNPADKDTMIFQQTFTFHNDKLQLTDEVRVIPCSVSSIKQRNNYQPTPSTGSEKNRILNKINGYSKPYGVAFDKNGKVIVNGT